MKTTNPNSVVRIFENGSEILPKIPFILEAELALTLQSDFGPPVPVPPMQLANLVGALTDKAFDIGFSSQYKQFGLQTWKSTSPVVFTINLSFYVGIAEEYNAYLEVMEPIKTLMKLPLPSETKRGMLIPPGPTLANAFKGETAKKLSNFISIEIGNTFRVTNALIQKVDPVFSKEKNQNGFPMSGKVAITVMSVMSATKEMMDENRDTFDYFVENGMSNEQLTAESRLNATQTFAGDFLGTDTRSVGEE